MAGPVMARSPELEAGPFNEEWNTFLLLPTGLCFYRGHVFSSQVVRQCYLMPGEYQSVKKEALDISPGYVYTQWQREKCRFQRKERTMSDIEQNEAEQEKLRLIQSRFGAAAADYVTSKVHASGPDLAWLVEAAALTGTERVLDVATGGGHTAFALAPHAAEVVALDLTVQMLEVAEKEARARRLTNISYLAGDAQAIPCEDNSFDVVACRQAAHHFPRWEQSLREWARVLKPGGKLLVVDSASPEEPALDIFLNGIEILRDPSHVRNHSRSEWQAALHAAGFTLQDVQMQGIYLDIPSWTQRMRTPPKLSHGLRNSCAAPPQPRRLTCRSRKKLVSWALRCPSSYCLERKQYKTYGSGSDAILLRTVRIAAEFAPVFSDKFAQCGQ